MLPPTTSRGEYDLALGPGRVVLTYCPHRHTWIRRYAQRMVLRGANDGHDPDAVMVAEELEPDYGEAQRKRIQTMKATVARKQEAMLHAVHELLTSTDVPLTVAEIADAHGYNHRAIADMLARLDWVRVVDSPQGKPAIYGLTTRDYACERYADIDHWMAHKPRTVGGLRNLMGKTPHYVRGLLARHPERYIPVYVKRGGLYYGLAGHTYPLPAGAKLVTHE